MSHFAVLVIGENPEEQLAPYHEFESTEIDDEYVQDVDITKEVQLDIDRGTLEKALIGYDLENVTVEDENNIDKKDKHKYRYAVVRDGKLVKAIHRTNPNYKWDWYQLGGRYEGFTLKDGKKLPYALKQDIAFDAEKNAIKLQSTECYKQFHDLLSSAKIEYPKTWSECRKEYEQIEEAREFYKNQLAVKIIRKKTQNVFGGGPLFIRICPLLTCIFDFYKGSLEEFVKRQVDSCCVTYAVIKDSKWYSKGDMGWFGISSNNVSDEDWNAQYWELVNSVPDTTLFSLYDCHI